MAKDGLHQYKYVLKSSKAPPSQHATSLEVAIKHFLSEANKALLEAQKKNEAVKNEEVEDLDEEEEGPIGGGTKSEKGKNSVVSSLKFLWESYRIVLEILRNYPKLESLYADTAKQAFSFCQTYGRKNEFRRLSEILRNHLLGLSKQQQNQQPGVMLSNPETAQLLLEVRFAQLNVATGMELWQESFRSVEDIHNLINQSKKTPPPEMMCLYFERLAQIFWQAKNHLFHAFSCLKYFRLLQKVKPDMTEAQRSAIASQVLLAGLSVPVSAGNDSDFGFDFDVQQEKNSRIATLLGSSSPISRGEFVTDLVGKGILELVYPEVAQLYKLMENKFSPLTFGGIFSNFLEFLRGRGELKVYADSIAANGFRRLVQQLAPFYQTIKLNRLFGLAKFVSPDEIEALLVESVTSGLFSARIDHRVGALRFSSDRLDSDDAKSRLSSLSSSLTTTVVNFDGYKEEQAARKKRVFNRTLEKLDEEHGSILMRMVLIEKRKEAEEEKSRRSVEEKEELERKKREEAQRLAEIKEEEKKKAQKELEEKILKAKRDLIEKEVAQDKPQPNVQVQVQKLKEQKQHMEGRLKKLAKDLDHLERARREEERPLLEAQSKELIEKDKQYHLEQSSKILEDLRAAHAKRLEEKKRLLTILPHRKGFEEGVTQQRVQSLEKILEKEKENRNLLQTDLDVALKRQQCLFAQKEALEEQRRKIEEAMRHKQEEEEEKKRKEREEKQKAEEERLAKLNEQAERQRKREQEILEKQNRSRQESAGVGGGTWKSRRTEAKKDGRAWLKTRWQLALTSFSRSALCQQ
uniref:PCI domain-containing protein n=1 Tax=Paramoeba aestuarina TaxID=180227 RepID=A0A7S4NK95_9EUKA